MRFRLHIFISLYVGLLLPEVALAHGTPFFEFNPDYYNVSSMVVFSQEPSEVFIPQNDHLRGLDLWLSNSNTAGSLTANLYNQYNDLLATKTLVVPAIANTEGGTHFHIDFPGQISVLSTAPYRVSLDTDIPTLQLYYADRITVVGHNAPYPSVYQNGVARLGEQDQAFSFKFALYETTEVIAPIISNVTTAALSATETRIAFNANEPVDYLVDYGPHGQDYTEHTTFSGTYSLCAAGVDTCQLTLGTAPATSYDFRLTVRDIWNNQSTAVGVFDSPDVAGGPTPTPTPSSSATPTGTPSPTPPDDTTPPIITNARVADLTNTTVSVAWSTNEVANAILLISLLPELTTAGGNTDPTLELEHYVTVGGLSPDTYYRAKLTSYDASNNQTETTLNFLTPVSAPSPTPTPTPSNPSSPTPPLNPPTDTPNPSATPPGGQEIQWDPPASGEPPDGYRVDIFDQSNHLIQSIIVRPGTHSIVINGLSSGKHRAIVYANDKETYQKVQVPTEFTIRKSFLELLKTAWPYITVVIVLGAGIMIWWKLRQKKNVPLGTPL